MKNKFKGFTLIELIIVMAIFAILMAAIMRMFTPIRETYVDSTLYESQRTAQNGIITYITESVRYSTDMGIYNDEGGSVTTAAGAIEEFATAYCTKYKVSAAKTNAVKDLIREKADFIVIDNTPTEYKGKNYFGRIIRRKIVAGDTTASDDYVTDKTKARLALGAAYYNQNTYSIGLDTTNKGNGVLAVTVASTASYGGKELNRGEADKIPFNDDLSTPDLIFVTGDVVCRNLTSSKSETASLGIKTPGMYDTAKYNDISTMKDEKTFIVFIDSELKSELRDAAE